MSRHNEDAAATSRRCKHCGDIVIGDHEARRAHRASCAAAPRSTSSLGDTTTVKVPSSMKMMRVPVSLQGVDVSKLSRKEKFDLLAAVVCRFCGQPHDVAECMQRLPHGYRERLKVNAEEHLTRGKIPFAQRTCVTPDLEGFDRKMDHLVKKLVPMSSVETSMAELKEATRWRKCQHCRKRVVSSFAVQHATHSCTVQQILRRVLALEIIFGCEDDLSINGDADVSENQRRQRALQRKLASELVQDTSSSVLAPLPPSVRRREQIALIVGSLNAVVPISDLVAPNNGAGDSMSEGVIRDAMPLIRARVEEWAAAVRSAEDSQTAPETSSVSAIVHAPPLLLLGGGSNGATQQHQTSSAPPPSQSGVNGTARKGARPAKGPKYSHETLSLAKQLNAGDIVSLQDQRQQKEFFVKRAASSVSNSQSPSRCGSASSSPDRRSPKHITRPTSAADGSAVVALPPLAPAARTSSVHQPPLD